MGTITMVQDQPDSLSTMAHDEGVERKPTAEFPGIRIVARQYGWGGFAKSLAVGENVLAAHLDLDGMFGQRRAAPARGRFPPGRLDGARRPGGAHGRAVATAMSGAPWARPRRLRCARARSDWWASISAPSCSMTLRSGVIDSLVVQVPFRMGYDSVQAAVAKINGRAVEKVENIAPRLGDRGDVNTLDLQARIDLKKYLP